MKRLTSITLALLMAVSLCMSPLHVYGQETEAGELVTEQELPQTEELVQPDTEVTPDGLEPPSEETTDQQVLSALKV